MARILALGHRIGSRSYGHVDLTTLTEAAIEADVRRAERVLGAALGVDKVFRPPHGRHDGRVRRVLAALGHEMVLWDTDTRDWDHEYWPDLWVSHRVRRIRSKRRTVVLAHDPQPNTATYFEALLTQLADSGLIDYQDPFTL